MVGIEGERKILSAKLARTIQSIKEIVKDHSDADIYVALQETNMDPNETTQKLLNQDPFHEVRRKRDKKKDVRLAQHTWYRGSTEARKPIEHVGQIMKSNPTGGDVPRGGYSRNVVAGNLLVGPIMKSNPTDRDVPRRGYSHYVGAGGSQEFRVVRDNRTNKDTTGEVKPPFPQSSTSPSEQRSLQASEKGSPVVSQKSSGGNHSPRQASAVQTVSHSVVLLVQGPKQNDPKPLSSLLASNHSVVGVYSSSSDPVHVPSADSRSAANVGAIKRELGAVGVRRQTSGNSVKPSSAPTNSISTSHLVKDRASSRGSSKSSSVTSTSDQPSKTSQLEPVLTSMSGSRLYSSNQYYSRLHQQVAGHQKSFQPPKEWKRKSGPKSNNHGHGVIGSTTKSVSHFSDISQDLKIDAVHLPDKLSQADIYENENVFIAGHIRVSDSDRSRLTFGSFGTEADSSRTTPSESITVRAGENSPTGVSISLSTSLLESPTVETSVSKHLDLVDDQVRNSSSNSLSSGGLSENLQPEKKGTSSPLNLDNYAHIGLARGNSPSFTHIESQQHPDPAELASFPVYNPQIGYDIPYFRPSMDEPVRGQGLQSPQEALDAHMTNNIPVSSIAMVQQQQQLMPQMYQRLHMSSFTNVMPYRQFISPMYVPPIPMTGYSGNPTYPHPSNGNSFLLMPGGSSHLGANDLKYGIQQFKSVPAGNPTGLGNFASPTGYTINAPGVVGGATGLEESLHLKYNDGNLYVPNPQAETSEIWIQNLREIPNLQSASYYNIAGQTPHGAYMSPHSGRNSFNVTAQSSHMQFSGLYPPPQAAGMANPHHLGPAMGGGSVNVGMAAAAAPVAQVGPYQQPQMSHLNWNANF